jgi:predicted transcriptional regulator
VKVEKRSKFQIYFDILQALCERVEADDRSCPTRIAHNVNLPYDRFRNCLDQLVHLEMVSREGEKLAVTEKGSEYVQWHRKMISFLKRMGLLT